jgi:hypothetical protein
LRNLFGFFHSFFNTTDHPESLLRQIIVFAF